MKPLLSQPFLAWPGVHYLARTRGWPKLRQAAMDARFQSGHWAHYEEPQQMVDLCEQLCAGGSMLQLGCGKNPLGRKLRSDSYSVMIGVDLAPSAIKAAEANAPARQLFTVCDMTRYQTKLLWKLVVFPESIFYLSLPQILRLLDYWHDRLEHGGSILVTIAQPVRYAAILKLIRRHFKVSVDRPLIAGEPQWLIVFN